MKKLTVISGKGGTGKTTIVSNLASLNEGLVLADCDVDAPNLHILLNPEILEEEIYKSGKLAVKDEDKCISCGICYDVCRFDAITNKEYKINPIKCDGCKVCVAQCPQNALDLVVDETGTIFKSDTKFGPMIHAKLKAGADNSGKLVSEVRKIADKTAEENDKKLILIDGSPGIGCPVIASLNGVDAALVVTEPTKSGLSDLKRILKVTEYFKIKSIVVINKYDLNEQITGEIKTYCQSRNVKVIGKVPFDPLINETLSRGELIVEVHRDSRIAISIKEIWREINNTL